MMPSPVEERCSRPCPGKRQSPGTPPQGRAGPGPSSANVPPFALVVRPHQKDDVFDGDDEGQRPDHQRHHADDRRRSSAAAGMGERFAHGVEGAGADVAEHHAHRSQGQPPEGLAADGARTGAARRLGALRVSRFRDGPLARRPLPSCNSPKQRDRYPLRFAQRLTSPLAAVIGPRRFVTNRLAPHAADRQDGWRSRETRR